MNVIEDYGAPLAALLHSFSLDAAVILVTIALFFWVSLRYGKGRSIAIIFALYIALIGYLNFPYFSSVFALTGSEEGSLLLRSVIFTVFLVVAYSVLNRSVARDLNVGVLGRWGEALLLALAAVALLLAFSYHILPIESLYDFGSSVDELFGPTSLLFWWLVAPLVALFLVTRKG